MSQRKQWHANGSTNIRSCAEITMLVGFKCEIRCFWFILHPQYQLDAPLWSLEDVISTSWCSETISTHDTTPRAWHQSHVCWSKGEQSTNETMNMHQGTLSYTEDSEDGLCLKTAFTQNAYSIWGFEALSEKHTKATNRKLGPVCNTWDSCIGNRICELTQILNFDMVMEWSSDPLSDW